jgi:pimeloyl-ACP methyl ester carboxylesterase
MGNYIQVYGAWCWYKVVPLLEKAGHRATALDLPALGRERTPVRDVSLQSYVDRVCDALDRLPGRAILVGHDAGGVVISQVAEQRPARNQTPAYLAAFLQVALATSQLTPEPLAPFTTPLDLSEGISPRALFDSMSTLWIMNRDGSGPNKLADDAGRPARGRAPSPLTRRTFLSLLVRRGGRRQFGGGSSKSEVAERSHL